MPNPFTPLYDLKSTNFDKHFLELLDNITEEQKARIPRGLREKIWRRTGRYSVNLSKLSMAEKWFVYVVALNRTLVTIALGAEDDPVITKDTIETTIRNFRKKAKNKETAEGYMDKVMFFFGDADLMQGLGYGRLICASDVYKLLLPYRDMKKTKVDSKFEQHLKDMRWINKFLINLEKNKRRIATDYGLNIGEYYALLYFWDGEKVGSSFYKEVFVNAYAAGKVVLQKAMTRLIKDGYMMSRGRKNQQLVSLTAKGQDTIQQIFENLIFKW